MATKVLVTEVPIFAPIIMGMAYSGSKPTPTIVIMMLVNVEEDCMATVPRMPIISPKSGLARTLDSLDRNPAAKGYEVLISFFFKFDQYKKVRTCSFSSQ